MKSWKQHPTALCSMPPQILCAKLIRSAAAEDAHQFSTTSKLDIPTGGLSQCLAKPLSRCLRIAALFGRVALPHAFTQISVSWTLPARRTVDSAAAFSGRSIRKFIDFVPPSNHQQASARRFALESIKQKATFNSLLIMHTPLVWSECFLFVIAHCAPV